MAQRLLKSVVVCAALVVTLVPRVNWAQVSTASMTGEVRDASGAVIPGAYVTVTQTDKQLVRETTTANDGVFVFPSLPVGPYTVKVEKAGFSTYEQTGIVLTVAQVATVPVTLQVGKVGQSVTVAAGATMLDTTTSTLSRLVGKRQVESLPLNGRNPAALVFLAAGSSNPVQNVDPSNTGYPTLQNGLVHPKEIAPSLNGLRGDGVYFSLDGANNIDTYQVTGGPFPNPDAVQEFRVVTTTYGAEYASAPSGAVNIVTKSGTNSFHGDMWEFVRNGDLNARNFFAPNQDVLKRNQFGGAAGGPILKDRLFVFASYEAMRLVNSSTITTFVPTDAERAGDFSAISTQLKNPVTGLPYTNNQIPTTQFDPVSVALLQYIPHSSAPGGQLQFTRPANQEDDQGVVRFDYVRGKHLLVARYFVDDFRWPKVDLAPNNNIIRSWWGQFSRWQNAMMGDTYSKSSNFLNEFRLSYLRDSSTTFAGESEVTLPGLGSKGFPPGQFQTLQALSVTGDFTIHPNNYDGFPRETFGVSDHVNVLRGRHEISFGTDLQYLKVKLLTDTAQNVSASFSGSFSGNGVSDYLLGRLFNWTQGDGIFVRARGDLFGFYGQDKIRVTPRLTLTAGLRWDPYLPLHALFGRMTCFRPGRQSQVFVNAPLGLLYPGDPGCNDTGTDSDLSTFQPRLGLAYMLDPQGKTVIRGGYGMYTMQFPLFSFLGFGFAQPYVRQYSLSAPGLLSAPWANFPGGSPFANGFELNDAPRPSNVQFLPPARVGSLTPDFKLPYVQQWSLSLERSLTPNTSIETSYVGNEATHLSLGADLNQAIYGPGATLANLQARRPYVNISNAIMIESVANSSFNAFELNLRHRIKGGFTLNSALTLSKAIDDVSSNANLILSSLPNQIPIPSDFRARRGLSDFDESHSWLSSFAWQVPKSAKSSRAMKALTSDWQFTGIFTLAAGQPFSITAAGGRSLSGNNLEFADFVPGVSPSLSTNRPHGQLVQQYFNTAAFTPNAVGTFGDSGRNILRGPGQTNLDFGVTKSFPIKERYRAVFRAEFFNFTNTPQFVVGNFTSPNTTTVGTPTFGRILTARDPRILQFALKFFW